MVHNSSKENLLCVQWLWFGVLPAYWDVSEPKQCCTLNQTQLTGASIWDIKKKANADICQNAEYRPDPIIGPSLIYKNTKNTYKYILM